MKPILDIRPEEKLAIVNGNDEVIGEATLNDAHRKGLLHREVCCYIISPKKQILLQKRTDTHTWDHSSAGHFSPAESYEEGVVREFEEELGIRLPLADFKEIAKERLNNPSIYGRNNKFVKIFLVRKDIPLEEFKPDSVEVEEIRYFNHDELVNLLSHPEKLTSSAKYIIEKYIIPLISKGKKIN